MRRSQARIIQYLKQVDLINKFAVKMAIKLEMDYDFLRTNLKIMEHKGWLTSHRRNNKVFYDLTEDAPIEEARLLLANK